MSSVKFQETVQTKVTDTANETVNKVAEEIRDLTSGDLTHRIGEYLTGGATGQGYLAVPLTCSCPAFGHS